MNIRKCNVCKTEINLNFDSYAYYHTVIKKQKRKTKRYVCKKCLDKLELPFHICFEFEYVRYEGLRVHPVHMGKNSPFKSIRTKDQYIINLDFPKDKETTLSSPQEVWDKVILDGVNINEAQDLHKQFCELFSSKPIAFNHAGYMHQCQI